MFVIAEAEAAAIRATFNQEGELSAAIELRWRLLGVDRRHNRTALAYPLPTISVSVVCAPQPSGNEVMGIPW